ncbi:alkaline shock response membrane anchor protein AmaP [Streptomyces sp. 4R-3d]|uniref:alkaline shock response membrane anchor protein AmaP n=1 Tax=Streptomyces sp. 4R-3d TaxID=2559605 RepID=UPI0010725F18|nr:alkaline shock response membrane anchor protein AmaP [Streptomyces sp. 4R-3d]TFI24991.1 alkaline shock response membrane anchor protein AmaP [Streptomyces sp. 4R-3d]
MIRTVNRLLLALIGLILFCAGGVAMARGQGWAVPSWWPYNSPHDVLLSRANRLRWRNEDWWWPVVIAALALILVLALWWLLAQFRRARLSEIAINTPDEDGATLNGKALERVLESEAEAQDGVAGARVRLTGHRTAPEVRVRLLLEPHAAPADTLNHFSSQVLANARHSAGLAAFPAEARLRVTKHHAEQVT